VKTAHRANVGRVGKVRVQSLLVVHRSVRLLLAWITQKLPTQAILSIEKSSSASRNILRPVSLWNFKFDLLCLLNPIILLGNERLCILGKPISISLWHDRLPIAQLIRMEVEAGGDAAPTQSAMLVWLYLGSIPLTPLIRRHFVG